MTSYDIKLPKNKNPKFPARCIVCGNSHPDGEVKATSRAVGLWTIFFMFGKVFSVQVPVCELCRSSYLKQKWIRTLLQWALVIAASAVVISFVKDIGGPFKKYIIAAFVLILLIPYILWETFVPRFFDMTVYTDTVTYEFKDKAYADEFASLNIKLSDILKKNI